MQINQIFRKPFIRLFIFFLSFSIVSCDCGGGGKKDKPSPNGGGGDNSKKAIVLFHGLAEPGGMKYFKDQLTADFPGLEVIALDRQNSQTEHIETQGKEAFAEIKKKNLSDKDLLLLGYSQGGLVAFSMYDQHQAELKNVKGLITYHTPWEGTPVSNTKPEDVKKIAAVFAKESPLQLPDLNQMIEGPLLQVHQNFTEGKGCEDLKPNSNFLKKVKSSLPKNKLPILALAGKEVALNKAITALLSKDKSIGQYASLFGNLPLDTLEPAWIKLIGAQPKQHDFLIPLDSQVAKNISGKAKFETKINKGIHHYNQITDSPEVYNQVKEAIKKYLGASASGKGGKGDKPKGKKGK